MQGSRVPSLFDRGSCESSKTFTPLHLPLLNPNTPLLPCSVPFASQIPSLEVCYGASSSPTKPLNSRNDCNSTLSSPFKRLAPLQCDIKHTFNSFLDII